MIQVYVDMKMVIWLEQSIFIRKVGCSNLGRDRSRTYFTKTGRGKFLCQTLCYQCIWPFRGPFKDLLLLIGHWRIKRLSFATLHWQCIFASHGFRSPSPVFSPLADLAGFCNSRGSPSSGFHKPSLQRWHRSLLTNGCF